MRRKLFKGRDYSMASPGWWDNDRAMPAPLEMWSELNRWYATTSMGRAGMKPAGPLGKPLGTSNADDVLTKYEAALKAGHSRNESIDMIGPGIDPRFGMDSDSVEQADNDARTRTTIVRYISRGRQRRRKAGGQ